MEHKKIRPALKGWNTEMMKKREKMELSIGGFGRGELAEKYVEIEESSTKKKTAKILDEGLEELIANKAELEYNIKQATMLYPEDSSLMNWKSSYEKSFFLNSEMIVEQNVVVKEREENEDDGEDRNENEENMVLVEEKNEEAIVCEEKERAENKDCEEAEKGDEMERGKKMMKESEKDDDVTEEIAKNVNEEGKKVIWPADTQYWNALATSTDIDDAFKNVNEENQHATKIIENVVAEMDIEATEIIENVVEEMDMQEKLSEKEKVNNEKIEEKKDEDKKEEENKEEKEKKQDKEKKEVEPKVPDIPNFNLGISQVDSSNKEKEKDVGEEVDSKKGQLVIRLKKRM